MTTNEWKTFKTSGTLNGVSSASKKSWQVNEYGQIRILFENGDIKPVFPSLSGGREGSRYLCLSNNDYKYIHRIVGEKFVPNPFNHPTIDHIDGNKLNNHYRNLEWVTYSENCKRAIANRGN